MNLCTVMIGGEAGQGLVTIGEILSKVLVRSGYRIVVTKSYQSRIRGGHNTFSIRFSDEVINAPREDKVDFLVALSEETVELHRAELTDKSIVIADKELSVESELCLQVPFKDLAESKYINTAALGVTAALLNLEQEVVRQAVDDRFEAKAGAEVAAKNEEVITKAYEWTAGQLLKFDSFHSQTSEVQRLTLDGNQGIALGAISSGLKFYSFYPMTPATSVALTVIKHADEAGIVVEQAEDEIAAINMALGASYAGAPSMVGTSGGGFALMVEGVSLAAMTETPIVIVVAQRPGPATGLPTRTEQGDLDLVLNAGHGEFPRAIFAPGSVEECFHLTREAFDLAERYQSPVFILTDQFLADSARAVDPTDLCLMQPITVGTDPKKVSKDYKRFKVAKDGVSPRLLPGSSSKLVVVDSDEHTEDGHITEDLGVRVCMVEKRLKKGEGLLSEVRPPEYAGCDEPDLLLVSWGSSRGAVGEASNALTASGTKTAVLHFSQVWPIDPKQFVDKIKTAKRVVAVEGNAFGQFTRLLRRETGIEIIEKILRYDGLPITPEYIMQRVGA